MSKPRLIIVSGRPGSGKTTLAHEIAREIGCPCISRDELKRGMVYSPVSPRAISRPRFGAPPT